MPSDFPKLSPSTCVAFLTTPFAFPSDHRFQSWLAAGVMPVTTMKINKKEVSLFILSCPLLYVSWSALKRPPQQVTGICVMTIVTNAFRVQALISLHATSLPGGPGLWSSSKGIATEEGYDSAGARRHLWSGHFIYRGNRTRAKKPDPGSDARSGLGFEG